MNEYKRVDLEYVRSMDRRAVSVPVLTEDQKLEYVCLHIDNLIKNAAIDHSKKITISLNGSVSVRIPEQEGGRSSTVNVTFNIYRPILGMNIMMSEFVKRIVNIYKERGFNVETTLYDGQVFFKLWIS